MTRQRNSQRRERSTSTRGGLVRGAVVLVVAAVTVSVMLAFLTPPVQGSELTSSSGPGATSRPDPTPTSGAEPSSDPSDGVQPSSDGSDAATPDTGALSDTSTTPVPEPVLGPQASFFEDFDTPAASGGPFATTYAGAWQAYDEGTSDKYYSGALISAHDGVMDVAMNGTQGAAGVFGPPATVWARTGGTFSIRMKVEGGRGNGTAVMLWPTSNDVAEGELDYPEGSFSGAPEVFHHWMVPGHANRAFRILTGASWRDWHTYTTVWVPGKSVSYFIDGVLLETVTASVPTTPHRYTFQIGNTGRPGHVLIDWVSIEP